MRQDDPCQWERKPSTAASVHRNGMSTVALAPSDNDCWTRKTSPERTPSPPPQSKSSPEEITALRPSQKEHQMVMPYADRHSQQKPRWYIEASCEPRQINYQGKAIGLGSFFKRRLFDYTNEEMNHPQGHDDCIRMIDLLPSDRECHKQDDDDSVLPIDWLEHTGKISLALNHSFGKRTWKRLMMGDHDPVFYTGCTMNFQMVCAQEHHEHTLETKRGIKVIQEMNTKHGIAPDAGVKKFQQEQAQALKDHVNDLMKCFQAKSRRWLDYSRE